MTESVELFVADNHPSFDGHFPGQPIVPGALLIDLAVRAVEKASGHAVIGIAQGKFLSPATPGEPLMLHFETTATSVRFDIETRAADKARKLASGRFTLRAKSA
jgi:3-hydroxyacyl-[acyl-carrier-protein] dehydratase